ncbi:MAG: AMP-binding protein [Burkholderiaceae bacterium]|jgi:long-chain acyl-CoA synthetase|nr:AMP-binding protein [Burkholderiaceae bacterium]
MPGPAIADQPLHECLRQQARTQPDAPAVIWYGGIMTWGQLDGWSDALAAHLQTLGVTHGAPVALFMNNCPQYLVAHYAIQKIGAIVCPCGPLNTAHEVRYQLADVQARVIIVAAGLLPIVEEVRADTAIAHVLAVRYADLLPSEPTLVLPAELQSEWQAQAQSPRPPLPAGVADMLAIAEQGMAQGRHPAAAPINMDDVALMTYTSGTIGLPKGAMLSFGNAAFKTRATAQAQGAESGDVFLSVAPLYHIAGMLNGVNVPIAVGARQVLLFRFDPLAVLQAIARYRVTHWYSIAPMNVACMQAQDQIPDAARYDLTSLRRNPVTSFGIIFTETLARQWQAFTRGPCISHEAAYGLSETHTMDTGMPVDAIRWGAHGKPMPGVEVRIRDPQTGADLPVGETGEITLRSPGNFKGYWQKPEATAQTLRQGWVWTGDMGRLDEEGYLTFVGRSKEMIKVSGYSVFPEEVETLLIHHPAVAQAAVLGVPDPARGEVVKAFIVCKPGGALDEASLIAWCRDNMAPYKVPRQVRFVESLPATGAGKVLRRLLKDVD